MNDRVTSCGRSLVIAAAFLAGGAAACGSGSVTSTSSSGGGTGGASTSSAGAGTGGLTTTGSGGMTTGVGGTTTGVGGTTTGVGGTTTGVGGTTTGVGGTTTGTGGAGAGCDCAAGQLCVVPSCRVVMGEECYFGTPDQGLWSCPPGTVRGAQFDLDCLQPGYACVTGCPPKAPFCLDLPPGCGGVATCGCLLENPCHASNSGACLDADIAGGVLSCSLAP